MGPHVAQGSEPFLMGGFLSHSDPERLGSEPFAIHWTFRTINMRKEEEEAVPCKQSVILAFLVLFSALKLKTEFLCVNPV